jgi:hypothetical protein
MSNAHHNSNINLPSIDVVARASPRSRSLSKACWYVIYWQSERAANRFSVAKKIVVVTIYAEGFVHAPKLRKTDAAMRLKLAGINCGVRPLAPMRASPTKSFGCGMDSSLR